MFVKHHSSGRRSSCGHSVQVKVTRFSSLMSPKSAWLKECAHTVPTLYLVKIKSSVQGYSLQTAQTVFLKVHLHRFVFILLVPGCLFLFVWFLYVLFCFCFSHFLHIVEGLMGIRLALMRPAFNKYHHYY